MRLNHLFFRYSWDSSKFTTHVAHGYWDKLENQQTFLNALLHKLHVRDAHGWFSITGSTLKQHGAGGLLAKYGDSVSKLLAAVSPEYKQTCRNTVEQLARELNLENVQQIVQIPLEYQKPFADFVK